MGARMSQHEGSHGFSNKKTSILEFQSKEEWRTHFDASKQTNKLLVIDFTATWCGPCQFMEPTLKEFASKYAEVEFIKIDVDKLAEVAREFEVEAMPTYVLVKRGKEVDRLVGAQKDGLQKKIEKHRT